MRCVSCVVSYLRFSTHLSAVNEGKDLKHDVRIVDVSQIEFLLTGIGVEEGFEGAASDGENEAMRRKAHQFWRR